MSVERNSAPIAPPCKSKAMAEMPGPKGIVLLGNANQIDKLRFHTSLEKWAQIFGPLYRFNLAGRQFVVTSDSAVIATLLHDRPAKMRRSSRMAELVEEGGFAGVFTAEGTNWLKQRRLVMRALTPQVIEQFFPTLASMTARLERRWRTMTDAGKPPDLLRDLKAFTLDVTIAIAFGTDINSLEDETNPLQQDIDFVLKRIGQRVATAFPYWRWFKRAPDRQADICTARIRHAVEGFIAEVRVRISTDPALRSKPRNLLESMVVACDELDSDFTDEEVFGNAMTMVFAGEDTTSHTAAWLLNFLARDETAFKGIAAEAKETLGESKVADSLAVLDRMSQIDDAIKEAMRLKPVAPFIPLQANEAIIIDGYMIPAGTIVTCMTRQADQREGRWPDPAEFRSSRWTQASENGSGKGTSQKMPGFGGGPRFCPGRYLAITEIKMMISMIAKNFTIAVDQQAGPVEERFTFTMTPSHLPVILNKKSSD